MSTRFNRNDANVPDDRLFAADFQVDQNGQDGDLLQIAKDFGCLPCLGSGLKVTEKEAATHKIEISAGWAYDVDGHRITVESAQEAVLIAWDGSTVNYVKITWASTTDTPRNAHRTGVSYNTRKKDSFTITVTTSAPGVNDIVLATVVQNGTDSMTIEVTERLARTCKLVPQSSIPAVAEEEGTGTGAEPPPPGQQNELPDLPKGRTIPMPIILSGTRSGAAWSGIETIMPEELGRTTAAQAAVSLSRVNLKSGTPLADVKVWIGDWGQGQRSGTPGQEKRCVFSMPTKSGVSAWDADLWITDPPGASKYFLVKHDESWYSQITDSGSDWVECVDDIPSGAAAEYYICPYAEKYESQTVPYETDAVLSVVQANTTRQTIRIASPVTPMALIKNLNLGGKYRLKVASVISGDNYTKWAETDFVVGSDLVVCWEPASAYLNVVAVDGGVEVTVPDKTSGKPEPEAFEICYTYGDDPPEPDFTNTEHPTLRFKERKFKLDVPPGKKVRVKARAERSRLIMKCSGSEKTLTSSELYVLAGGVSLRRNYKLFTNPISESSVAASGTKLADQQKLPNPIWVKSISLYNPTDSSQTNFEVYVHGSNEAYTSGRKIQIGTGGDATEVGARGWVQKAISDYKITDPAVMVTIKNIDTGSQNFTLRYTVEYQEDSPTETV